MDSVVDSDTVRSEPFWPDPDPIHSPDPTIKCYETRKKSNKLNSYFLTFLLNITNQL